MNPVEQIAGTRLEYRLSGAQSFGPMVVGVVLVAAIVPMAWLTITSANPAGNVPLLLLGLAVFTSGAFLLSWVVRSRLILEGNQLRVRTRRGEQVCDVSEIAGVRTFSTRSGTISVLCLKNSSRRIEFSRFAIDDAFRNWLAQFPNLDDQDRKAMLDQIAQDQELGATPEERLDVLRRAKVWSTGLPVATVAAAGIYVFGPAVAKLAAGAALFLVPVAIMMLLHRSPRVYALFKPKSDPRAELMASIMIAAPALLIGSQQVVPESQQINLVSFSPLLVWILLIAAVFFVAFYRSVRANVQASNAVLALVFIAGLYGAGAALWANVWGDNAQPAIYRAHVLTKYTHVSSGRSHSTSYYLETQEWGPDPTWKVKVSRRMYRETNQGDLICLSVKPGLLHAPWYQADHCSE